MIMELAKRVGLNRIKPLYYVYHKYFCRDPHLLNMPTRPTIMKTDGQQFWASSPRESFIGRSIFFRGVWEPEATAIVNRSIKKDMTVVDVGAHTGYYSLLFAKRVGPTGRVFAFEPEALGLDFLRRNMALNGYGNTTIVPAALSDWSGTATVQGKTYLCGDDEGTDVGQRPSDLCHAAESTAKQARSADPATNVDEPVRAAVFDELVPEFAITRLDFIKIDVEGAEWHVLRGMRGSLDRWSPMLLLEIHPTQLKRCDRSENHVLRLLDELGYARQLVGSPSSSGVYTVFCQRD